MVALATPMFSDGAIDYAALARLIEFHIERQTDALVVVGTTGESATLDFPEHRQVIRFAVEQVRGRVPAPLLPPVVAAPPRPMIDARSPTDASAAAVPGPTAANATPSGTEMSPSRRAAS